MTYEEYAELSFHQRVDLLEQHPAEYERLTEEHCQRAEAAAGKSAAELRFAWRLFQALATAMLVVAGAAVIASAFAN